MPILPPLRPLPKLTLTAALAALSATAGCAPAEPAPAERSSPIEGGEASTERSVVAIIASPPDSETKRLCTGTLISPRVVLTARHCVASFLADAVRCGQARLGEPYEAERLLVFSGDDASRRSSAPPEAEHRVARAEVPPDGDDVCGFDIAVVVLERPAGDEFVPLEIREGDDVAPGERYRIAGYGAADAEDEGSGLRRGRDDLSISCANEACATPTIAAGEWRGEAGVCSGDSGGPAIDEEGRVIGVASRSRAGSCDAPVYASVYRWRDWLREMVAKAEGTIEPGGDEAEPRGDDEAEPKQAPPAASGDGCAVGRGPGRPASSGGALAFAALALALLGRGRRRA